MERCGEPEGGLEAAADWGQSSSVSGGVLLALAILRLTILYPVVTLGLPFILPYKAISSPPSVEESGYALGSTSLTGLVRAPAPGSLEAQPGAFQSPALFLRLNILLLSLSLSWRLSVRQRGIYSSSFVPPHPSVPHPLALALRSSQLSTV